MDETTNLKQIAQVLLFDRDRRLVIYLRDDNPEIPFPNHWDLLGGHLEDGETPEQALVREIKEEIGIELTDWKAFRRFDCVQGDVYPNVKHIYWATIEKSPAELTLYEGQKLASIAMAERTEVKFANILGAVVDAFIDAGLWPESVDNF
ncbi:MAG TPA: NUDIX domain-containing protein [Candidatus Binatia bacterium]|jgi:8-oxo-dGTP diphosphatase